PPGAGALPKDPGRLAQEVTWVSQCSYSGRRPVAAYRRCCDPGNYIIAGDAFASTLNREELAKYIQTVGR
ncbi:MAG: hypothetical protein RQ993_02405, partial [Bacteroidota bacterium]|nr:hypothetical protein [Bacteroidota bacterium]